MAKTIEELETTVEQLNAAVEAKTTEFTAYKADMEAKLKALQAESDKTEDEKKKEMEAKKAAEEKEEEEKNKQKDAQIIYLAQQAKKPRITALQAAYKGKVSEDVLKIYQASWDSMTLDQLDAEVSKISVFAPKIVTESPFMAMTQPLAASVKDPLVASYETKSINELFGGQTA